MDVSVVLYVHNGGDYLENAMDSILAQTHRGFELCVVDDGSTDSTASLLERYRVNDPRVRVQRQAHLGSDRLHETVNNAIAMTRHDVIATANADDVWLPTKLETQVAAFVADPELDVCWHEATFIDAGGRVVHGGFRPIPSPLPAAPPRPWHFAAGNPVPNPTTMFRRSILRRIGLQEAGQMHDHQFWMKATIEGCRFLGLPDRLIRYRVHEASESTATDKQVRTHTKHAECVAMMIERHGIEGLFPELALVDNDPDSVAWAWSYLGSMLWDRQRHELAEQCWTQSMTHAANAGPMCNLGIAATRTDDRHRAITLFSAAAEAGVGRARAALASPHTATDTAPLPWHGALPPVVELVDEVTAGRVELPHPPALSAAHALLIIGSIPEIPSVPANRDAIADVIAGHRYRTGGAPSRLAVVATSDEGLGEVVAAYEHLQQGAPVLLEGLDIEGLTVRPGSLGSLVDAHLLDGAMLLGSDDPRPIGESAAPNEINEEPPLPATAPAMLAG